MGPILEGGRTTGFLLVGRPRAVRGHPTPEADGDTAAAHLEAAPGRDDTPVVYDFGLLDQGATTPGADDRLDTLAFTVLDTETTGLDPLRYDRVVSIGAVRVDRGRVRADDVLDRLVDPGRPIPPEATAVHGITDDMVAGRSKLPDVLVDLVRFAADTVLVGHDIAFDLAFLRRGEAKAGVQLPQRVLDTMLLAAVLYPSEDKIDLETLAQHYGVAVLGRHTALGDALVTAELLVRMIPHLAALGITTYGQAEAASTATKRAHEGARRF
jgi:DNA polymerase-3 subunit epsilon